EQYLGVFGVDALCLGDEVFFTEINPRFQGSSALSAEIAAALDIPDVHLDHLAATLGLVPGEPDLTVREWAERQPARSHIVVHNTSGTPVYLDMANPLPALERSMRLTQVLPNGVRALEGAALCRIVFERSVTRTGFEIDQGASGHIDRLVSVFST